MGNILQWFFPIWGYLVYSEIYHVQFTNCETQSSLETMNYKLKCLLFLMSFPLIYETKF